MRLVDILKHTEEGGYAVGSFSPRYTYMIKPVLEAAQECNSPAIIQISSKEIDRYGITPGEFAEEYCRLLRELSITVPTTLHLDHTYDFDTIKEAIAAGFESVMIDASAKEFDENVSLTGRVTAYAHERGVDVEAELGKIGANDQIETDGDDSEKYTDPKEAGRFVEETGVDALAASVGTAHGVYTVRQPSVQYDLIRAIKDRTHVYLVLHGGSGVPAEMVIRSYQLEGGGVSKVNIATDLELAFLAALNREERGTNKWCGSLSEEELEKGRTAVRELVKEKIRDYLHSDNRARDFESV